MFKLKVVTSLLIAISLLGCATLENLGKTPEEIVASRAEARWRALIAGDLETAYGYLTPGYRSVKSFERYRSRIKGVGVWKDVKVESVSCKGDNCEADVRVYARFMHPRMVKPLDTDELIKEGWLYDEQEDNWFFVAE
jgi:hypothetical protein